MTRRNDIAECCAKLGSCTISEGSIRFQDTIPKMLIALAELSPEAYSQAQNPGCGYRLVASYVLEDRDHEWWGSVQAAGVFEALVDALCEYAPEGFYFGIHEGDPACLGFWPYGADE